MRLIITNLPGVGPTIEFETAKEVKTPAEINRRNRLEARVKALLKEVSNGMPHYVKKLKRSGKGLKKTD
jgi:hypothetical protein